MNPYRYWPSRGGHARHGSNRTLGAFTMGAVVAAVAIVSACGAPAGDDASSADAIGSTICQQGGGLFCGGDHVANGDPSVLYNCLRANARPRGATRCAFGCTTHASGTNDACASQPSGPPTTKCTTGAAWDVDVQQAIRAAFGGFGDVAIQVSQCESGDNGTTASNPNGGDQNGPYLGLFQMGSAERTQYKADWKSGTCAEDQAAAAFHMFRDNGSSWGRWDCSPQKKALPSCPSSDYPTSAWPEVWTCHGAPGQTTVMHECRARHPTTTTCASGQTCQSGGLNKDDVCGTSSGGGTPTAGDPHPLDAASLAYPAPGRCVGGYSPGVGDHTRPDVFAVDFANAGWTKGGPAAAVFGGTVVWAGADPEPANGRWIYGNAVAITDNQGHYAMYAHLDSIDPAVGAGRPVSKGQTLGVVGSSGCPYSAAACATDAHLHFALRLGPQTATIGSLDALYGKTAGVPWTSYHTDWTLAYNASRAASVSCDDVQSWGIWPGHTGTQLCGGTSSHACSGGGGGEGSLGEADGTACQYDADCQSGWCACNGTPSPTCQPAGTSRACAISTAPGSDFTVCTQNGDCNSGLCGCNGGSVHLCLPNNGQYSAACTVVGGGTCDACTNYNEPEGGCLTGYQCVQGCMVQNGCTRNAGSTGSANGASCTSDGQCASQWCGCNGGSVQQCLPDSRFSKACVPPPPPPPPPPSSVGNGAPCTSSSQCQSNLCAYNYSPGERCWPAGTPIAAGDPAIFACGAPYTACTTSQGVATCCYNGAEVSPASCMGMPIQGCPGVASTCAAPHRCMGSDFSSCAADETQLAAGDCFTPYVTYINAGSPPSGPLYDAWASCACHACDGFPNPNPLCAAYGF